MPVLVDYNMTFLHKSWEWLNDPEIKTLTMTPDFTREDQLAFYNSLPDRKNYWIRGLMENDCPVGAMGLKHINNRNAEYWGYIGEKEFWGKGIGTFMMQQAIKKATELGLDQLYLFVDEENQRAKQLYAGNGFLCIGPGKMEKYLLNV